MQGLQCVDKDVTHQLDLHPHSPPTTAIPLHLRPPPLSQDNPSELRLAMDNCLPTDPWHLLSKVLLLRKASIAYYKLATRKMEALRYGAALRNIRMALICFSAMERLNRKKAEDNHHILSDILGTTGDVRMFMARRTVQYTVYMEQYRANLMYDDVIRTSAMKEVSHFEYDWCTEVTASLKSNLTASVQCHERAIEVDDRATSLASLTRRLGNGRNELGVFYMNLVLESVVNVKEIQGSKPSEALERQWRLSYECFDTALQAFRSSKDDVNQALVLSNIGRLMRICAQAYCDTQEFSTQEHHFYQQAIDCYERALTHLPKSPDRLRASVTWELSTTFFNLGQLMQDNPPLSLFDQHQVEKKVIDALSKAETYCVINDATNDGEVTARRLRMAHINYKLGSLHHHAYRSKEEGSRRRYMKQLAVTQYDRSVTLYQKTESHCECLRAQMELVALHEFTYTDQSGHDGRVRSLEVAMDTLLCCEGTLSRLLEGDVDDLQEPTKLLDILHSRLSFVLLHLTKLYSSRKKSAGAEVTKALYSKVLKLGITPDTDLRTKCGLLKDILSDIRTVWTDRLATNSKT